MAIRPARRVGIDHPSSSSDEVSCDPTVLWILIVVSSLTLLLGLVTLLVCLGNVRQEIVGECPQELLAQSSPKELVRE